MKLIYINSENTSVMEAQVLSLINYYSRTNKFSDIFLLQGYKNNSEKVILKKKLEGFHTTVLWFKRWPYYTVFSYFFYNSIRKILIHLDLDDRTIIHVRGELYGSIIYEYLNKKKSNAKLLVDMRGVILEQIDNYEINNILLKRNKILFFKNVYRKISKNVQITVVSDALKEYLVTNYGFQKQNICVHPNIAGEQFTFNSNLRQEIRKELGLLEDDIVAICSSNGDAAWQKDKNVIIPLLAQNVKVINLSPTSQEIPGVLNRLVSFNSMPAYLSAADIAILWRDDNIVNNTASPSKFSEFIAMGLWVIHNDTVRIASDFIRQYNSGSLVKSVNEITKQQINRYSNNQRIHFSTLGRNIFGVENIANSYITNYKKILKKAE